AAEEELSVVREKEAEGAVQAAKEKEETDVLSPSAAPAKKAPERYSMSEEKQAAGNIQASDTDEFFSPGRHDLQDAQEEIMTLRLQLIAAE
ncbi:unnamed protein product, partial [Polarella glacialis]